MTIRIELPLPPKVLHPNGRTRQHGYRAAMVRKARGEAALVAKPLRPAIPWKRATVRAEFFMPRRMDNDSLVGWIKAYLDGCQDVGVVANDSGFSTPEVIQHTGKAAWPPRLVLTIEEVV